MERFTRAKKFVQKHRVSIAFTAGTVATAVVLNKTPAFRRELVVTATPDDLQKLLDDPSGVLAWTTNKYATVYLLNDDNPKL